MECTLKLSVEIALEELQVLVSKVCANIVFRRNHAVDLTVLPRFRSPVDTTGDGEGDAFASINETRTAAIKAA